MYAFNCTRYRIDKARKWRASCEGFVLPKKEQLFRQCLDLQTSSKHFLDFIFSNGLLQDVAYGMTALKYDSGDVQTIAVLTTKFSHAIACYRETCTDVNYTPLSDSSLLRILHAIKTITKKEPRWSQ